MRLSAAAVCLCIAHAAAFVGRGHPTSRAPARGMPASRAPARGMPSSRAPCVRVARSRPLALAPPDVGSSMLVAETSTSELGIALVLPLIVYKLAATAMGYRLQPTLDFTIAGAVTVVVWLGLRESHIL